MNNRRHHRRKQQAKVRAALRYLKGVRGLGPTQAVLRATRLQAYYAQHEALGSDVPL